MDDECSYTNIILSTKISSMQFIENGILIQLYRGVKRPQHVFFKRNVPVQFVCIPLHVPLARHFLEEEPLRIYPSLQKNCTRLGKNVKLPNNAPFRGVDNGPQLTAV